MKDNLHNLGLLVLRLVAGGTMFTHGFGKIMGFGEMSATFPDPIGLGSSLSLGLVVFAEAICSLLLIAGVFTRLVSIPLLITMLVAFFIIHADDPFGKKELPFVYAGMFLTLLLTGGGKYVALRGKKLSLD